MTEKYLSKDKKIEYSIVERKSKNKYPFVIVAEDVDHIVGMEMGRVETREKALEIIGRWTA